MYFKCSCVLTANRVFRKNVFSWSAVISGFGLNGLYSEAIDLFDQMISENQLPKRTSVAVLSACGHSGRVEEGWNYFRSMRREYGIVPMVEHFACMVDLLGKAGRIDEALSSIQYMPMDPGAFTWGALLSACRIHKWMNLAKDVAMKLLTLETVKSSVYVLLLNIYANAGMWDRVRKIMLKFGQKGLHKTSGFSSTEVDEICIYFQKFGWLIGSQKLVEFGLL